MGARTVCHTWEDLLPEEFREEFARAPIAYWTCGAMEEHGLHNPMGADYLIPYEICRRAVEISGGILFPPIPVAPAFWPPWSRDVLRSGSRELYPPSLWIGGETCERLYVEMFESLADLGFKVCMAISGHAPAFLMLSEIESRFAGRMGAMRFWSGSNRVNLDIIQLGGFVPQEFDLCGHGTMLETSLMCAIRPDRVDLARAARIQQDPLPTQLRLQRPEQLAKIPRSNAALGNERLNEAGRRLAAAAAQLLSESAP